MRALFFAIVSHYRDSTLGESSSDNSIILMIAFNGVLTSCDADASKISAI